MHGDYIYNFDFFFYKILSIFSKFFISIPKENFMLAPKDIPISFIIFPNFKSLNFSIIAIIEFSSKALNISLWRNYSPINKSFRRIKLIINNFHQTCSSCSSHFFYNNSFISFNSIMQCFGLRSK